VLGLGGWAPSATARLERLACEMNEFLGLTAAPAGGSSYGDSSGSGSSDAPRWLSLSQARADLFAGRSGSDPKENTGVAMMEFMASQQHQQQPPQTMARQLDNLSRGATNAAPAAPIVAQVVPSSGIRSPLTAAGGGGFGLGSGLSLAPTAAPIQAHVFMAGGAAGGGGGGGGGGGQQQVQEGLVAQLQQLADLKAAGALSEREYVAAKEKLLGS
jgi:hypothetical protein